MKKKDFVYTTFETPFGLTGLAARNGKLIRICNRINSAGEFKDFLISQHYQPVTKHPKLFEDLIRQFNLYFKGLLKNFNWPLDISLGTHFQKNVWKCLRTIPYGETRSYRWLACSIGNPNASRATGNANGKNPLPIIIPCHRVIRENGQLGGYTSGTDIKTFLLQIEGKGYGAI